MEIGGRTPVPFGLGVQHGARRQQLVDHRYVARLSFMSIELAVTGHPAMASSFGLLLRGERPDQLVPFKQRTPLLTMLKGIDHSTRRFQTEVGPVPGVRIPVLTLGTAGGVRAGPGNLDRTIGGVSA
jgi:hypothetical protein